METLKKRVLNLGAGTQSSVVAIMCDRGELPPVDVAIFADTKAEPPEVYSHLEWLRGQLKNTPVVTVSEGNLEQDFIEFRQYKKFGCGNIPLFLINPDGTHGMTRRQCTHRFKIVPIERYIKREIMGIPKGGRVPQGYELTQVFGISFDERHRAKNGNGDPHWMKRSYPLIDMKLNRMQVIAMAERWFPDHKFPRSACYFCPFHSDAEWRNMKVNDPTQFERAVGFEKQIQTSPDIETNGRRRLVGLPFLHAARIPLDQVDFRNAEDHGQLTLDGMANECEGMCGV